jgi:D-sedoheptulose 7-phosphate isomerase
MGIQDADWKSRYYVRDFLSLISSVSQSITVEQSQLINGVVDILYEAWVCRKTVFVIGNGGSASNATHFAADLSKTIIESPGERGIRAQALFDNVPLVGALINDWGWKGLFLEQLRTNLVGKGDVVAAFSVHGGSGSDQAGKWSQNLLQALQFAKDNEAKTIGFSGFDGGAMKEICDVCIVVPADSTPAVESMHSVLAHLITFRLKHLINSKPAEGGTK